MKRVLWLALVLALPARADILLDGNQHIGDNDTTNSPSDQFVPGANVERDQIRAYPSNFHLSQAATITGITLLNPIGLDGSVQVQVDGSTVGINFCAACSTCTGRTVCAASVTLTPTVPFALAAGFHTIAVDGVSTSNDIGFSGITLVSTATTTSRMFNQRRHIGDDNDSKDEYDITSTSNNWYPDDVEGSSVSMTFTLTANQRLLEIDFRRLRDVDTNNAQVLVDGQFVGNLLDTSAPGSALEADPTKLTTSLLLLAGAHTLKVQAGTISPGNLDSISWDDIILLFASTGSSGNAGFFNAVDAGANALSGQITTKIAGGSASLDLYALNAFGTGVDATYTGTAGVDVLYATDNSGPLDIYGCRSTWTVAQSLGSFAFTAGKATITPAFFTTGTREARIRITDGTTGASGCSGDNFAVRPDAFSLEVMHGTETTAGTTEDLNNTGSAGLPRHKAGRPFTILATAVAAGGATATAYDGTPNSAVGHALAPATIDGTTTVTSWTSLGSGVLRTDTAKYLEAGPAQFVVTDSSYASVDADDSSSAQMNIVGTVNAGRFIPDHFTLTSETIAPAFLTACGSFTYVGQPFLISPAPYRMSITAVETNGAVTRNYAGTLYKLPAGNLSTDTSYVTLAQAVAPTTPVTPDHALTNMGNGVTRYELLPTEFAFTRPVTPVVPFDAEIAIQPGALNETDGVDFSPSPGRIGAPTAGNGITFTGTGADPKALRYGRLVVDNAQGSERLPLDVPLRAEYWESVSGNAGFVTSTADNCTTLTAAQAQLGGTFASNTSVTSVSSPLAAGLGSIRLAAPNASGAVTVTAKIATVAPLALWLRTDDADANTDYDNEPQGLATFGLFSNGDKRIYQREVIGP